MIPKFLGTMLLLAWCNMLLSQNTANDGVPNYNGEFGYGSNMGLYNGWSDDQLANIGIGNPALGISGAGVNSLRPLLPEYFLEFFGYPIRLGTFQHYSNLGAPNNVAIIGYPTEEHRDPNEYCNGFPAESFANMYLPIWDDGTDGSPINEDNYYAHYVYRMVDVYKDYVHFWEVLNEPDTDLSGNGWKPRGMAGNWYDNVPDPCEYTFYAPIYLYIRMLKITYEVVKALDPEAYVAVGGLGNPSFLDLILRHTDNPADGSITSDYPLKGGAYFDVLSYHSYPHLDGSLREYDNDVGGFVFHRHSDRAVSGYLNRAAAFQVVLADYGYDGATYPPKKVISTETNVPRQSFTYHGSDAFQRNYAIKVAIAAQQAGHLQMHLYTMGDDVLENDATGEFQLMGLYKSLSNAAPYNVVKNDIAIAYKTVSDALDNLTYDANRTGQMNIPGNVGGAAFIDAQGNYTYALWAITKTDQSENATASYSFPSSLATGQLQVKAWDFSETLDISTVNPQGISLTGSPIFLTPSQADELTVIAGIDQDICPGDSYTLTAIASGGTSPYTYTWDQSLGNGAMHTVFPNSTTTYTVTATDANNNISIDQITITVLASCTATIGDFVFEDQNDNGLQDNGEPGIDGIAINLIGTDLQGNSVNLNTTSGTNGGYQFADLDPGNYQLSFQTPSGYTIATANAGGNEALDSDIDNNGNTGTISLEAGAINNDVDAGFVVETQEEGLNISCPEDILVNVNPNDSGAEVSWDPPTGTTDCQWGGIGFVQIRGPQSGSFIPVNTPTIIDYYAYDACSNAAFCSFTIMVSDQQDCAAQEGNACDDNDPCTENDAYDADCNCAGTLIDSDNDGICNLDDNCPDTANPNQEDVDNDGIGDLCDDCNVAIGSPCDDGDDCTENDVYDANCNCAGTVVDSDSDGICDAEDNCPNTSNPDQTDTDSNGIGDACDGCAFPEGSPCDDNDPCTENDIYDADCNCAGTLIDSDNDGICNLDDNCPDTANPNQEDVDNDGIGDLCDDCNVATGSPCDDGNDCTENDVYDANCNCAGIIADADNDGICDAEDNCPGTSNPDQADTDNNGIGDACEIPQEGLVLSCPGNILVSVSTQESGAIVTWETPTAVTDCQWGGIGIIQIAGPPNGSTFPIGVTNISYYAYDACSNAAFCSFTITVNNQQDCAAQEGNTCDDNNACTENDVYDADCNCVGTLIDSDNDGICDIDDNCPDTANPNQEDVDNDGIGDLCDDCNVVTGSPCDDGDDCTVNDVYDANCNCAGTLADMDNDGVCDAEDNCPNTSNPDQTDTDSNGIGDACEGCAFPEGSPCDDNDPCTENDAYDADCNCVGTFTDNDNDGVCNANDNCPDVSNPDQVDSNNNNIGDACEVQEEGLIVSCSNDILVNISPQESGAVVTWDAPTGVTDCQWGGIGIIQIAGPPSGSTFPLGVTTITYYAYDACSNEVTCNFTVTVTQNAGLQGGNNTLARTESQNNAISTPDFRIFPNPATEKAHLDLKAFSGKDIQILILDINGRIIQEIKLKNVQDQLHELDLSHISNGLYNVIIKGKDINPVAKRLVVSKTY